MSEKKLPVLKIFMSHVCPICPITKRAINNIKPQLEGKVEIKEYSTLTPIGRKEALKLSVLSIPQVFLEDTLIVRGYPSKDVKTEEQLLEKIQNTLRTIRL